jgi:hypothetical protein
MNVRLSRNADCDNLIANGDCNGVVIMPVYRNRIAGPNLDFKNIYIVIVKGKMVMRFVVHANDRGNVETGSLGQKGKR